MNNFVRDDIKCVIFDMDGTLFDTERLGMEMWQEAIKRLDAPLNDEFKRRIIGVNRATSKAIANEMFGENSRFDETAALAGELFTASIEKNGVPLKDGVFELLTHLEEKEIKTALATSTSRISAERTLKRAGVYKFFSAFAFGDEILNGKPSPDIFLLAARRLNEDISRCAVVEDSPNGVKAAKKSGAFTVAIPDLVPLEQDYKEFYDVSFKSLAELIDLF